MPVFWSEWDVLDVFVGAEELVIFSGGLWGLCQIIPLFLREKVKIASRKALKMAVSLAPPAFAGFLALVQGPFFWFRGGFFWFKGGFFWFRGEFSGSRRNFLGERPVFLGSFALTVTNFYMGVSPIYGTRVSIRGCLVTAVVPPQIKGPLRVCRGPYFFSLKRHTNFRHA